MGPHQTMAGTDSAPQRIIGRTDVDARDAADRFVADEQASLAPCNDSPRGLPMLPTPPSVAPSPACVGPAAVPFDVEAALAWLDTTTVAPLCVQDVGARARSERVRLEVQAAAEGALQALVSAERGGDRAGLACEAFHCWDAAFKIGLFNGGNHHNALPRQQGTQSSFVRHVGEAHEEGGRAKSLSSEQVIALLNAAVSQATLTDVVSSTWFVLRYAAALEVSLPKATALYTFESLFGRLQMEVEETGGASEPTEPIIRKAAALLDEIEKTTSLTVSEGSQRRWRLFRSMKEVSGPWEDILSSWPSEGRGHDMPILGNLHPHDWGVRWIVPAHEGAACSPALQISAQRNVYLIWSQDTLEVVITEQALPRAPRVSCGALHIADLAMDAGTSSRGGERYTARIGLPRHGGEVIISVDLGVSGRC
jgi:hypothetical protein